MTRAIDRKYFVSNQGDIRKISDGTAIPEDEPLFLFRAKDRLALSILVDYASLCAANGCSVGQLELIHRRIADFLAWQKNNEALMKLPTSEAGDDYS